MSDEFKCVILNLKLNFRKIKDKKGMSSSVISEKKAVNNNTILCKDSSTPDKPRLKSSKKCRKCGEIGHIEKYCLTTDGGCIFIGDLPPSYTEEDVKTLVEDSGGLVVNVRSGMDKLGSRWALVNMETREGGETVIKALDEVEVKGREIYVKWRDSGMWTCPDPSCGQKNFLSNDACFRCKFPFEKVKLFDKK